MEDIGNHGYLKEDFIMKACEVRSGKDLIIYMKQCGSQIISDTIGDDYVRRVVVVNKNRSDDRINIAFTDGTILWATHYWCGSLIKSTPLKIRHSDNPEKICKLIWAMSRKRRTRV